MHRYEHKSMTKAEYDTRSMRKSVNTFARRLGKACAGDGLTTMFSLKGSCLFNFKVAASQHVAIYDGTYAIWSRRRYLKVKFAARRHALAAFQVLADRISYDNTCAVGFGDCSKTTGFKGLSPGAPLGKFKRWMVKRNYNITEIDEFRTTKSSVCCPGSDTKSMRHGRPPDAADFGKPHWTNTIHGILICTKCGTNWNRDKAASINIRDIFVIQYVRHQQRPDRFSRTATM